MMMMMGSRSISFVATAAVLFLQLLTSVSPSTAFITAPKSVTVDPSGAGDFRTITDAINSVPAWNKDWFRIHVKAGVYKEKVMVPQNATFLLLEGEGSYTTSIEWDDHARPSAAAAAASFDVGGDKTPASYYLEQAMKTGTTATFTSYAENVIVRYISIKNTYAGPEIMPALAALVGGDKTSFFSCNFYGVQDTLADLAGRHYFQDCYIEGTVDFIFGYAQTIYKWCKIGNYGKLQFPGYVTANGKIKPTAEGGFVFDSCELVGTHPTYLGRAWARYSTVIFFNTSMTSSVVPLGWDAWNVGSEHAWDTTYAEVGCSGPGSDTSGRVPWEKKMDLEQVQKYTDISFIDGQSWLLKQLS